MDNILKELTPTLPAVAENIKQIMISEDYFLLATTEQRLNFLHFLGVSLEQSGIALTEEDCELIRVIFR